MQKKKNKNQLEQKKKNVSEYTDKLSKPLKKMGANLKGNWHAG